MGDDRCASALRELSLCALRTVLCRACDRRLCHRGARRGAVAVAWAGVGGAIIARRHCRGALGRADAGHEAPRHQPWLHSRLLCRRSSAAIRSPLSADRPNPDFRLADLAAHAALRPSAKCRRHGYACKRICGRRGSTRRGSIAFPIAAWPENLDALSEGRIEAAQFFEPVVEEALASGRGHLWHTASTRGRTSYTAFVTTRDQLVRDAEPLLRMVRAIQRTQQWIHTQSAQEIAAAISSFFPALDSGVLTAALTRYQVTVGMGARSGIARGRL